VFQIFSAHETLCFKARNTLFLRPKHFVSRLETLWNQDVLSLFACLLDKILTLDKNNPFFYSRFIEIFVPLHHD